MGKKRLVTSAWSSLSTARSKPLTLWKIILSITMMSSKSLVATTSCPRRMRPSYWTQRLDSIYHKFKRWMHLLIWWPQPCPCIRSHCINLKGGTLAVRVIMMALPKQLSSSKPSITVHHLSHSNDEEPKMPSSSTIPPDLYRKTTRNYLKVTPLARVDYQN